MLNSVQNIVVMKLRKEKIMNIVEPIRQKRDLKRIERVLKKQNLRDLLLFTVGTNCGLRFT